MSITPAQISRVDRIFTANNWPKDLVMRFDKGTVFDNICALVSMLSEEEKGLLFALLERYSLYQDTSYVALLQQSLSRIPPALIDSCKEVFLIPVLSPIDKAKEKTKSSSALPYFAHRVAIPRLPAFQGKKISAIQNSNALVREHQRRKKGSLLIFLDDFIGTGKTVCEALSDYLQLCPDNDDSTVVSALVAMREGVEKILPSVDCVVSAKVLEKGISGADYFAEPNAALQTMIGISKRLKVSERYHLGYGDSESLVTMARTPNNTFPVFWCNNTCNGEDWPSPFPR